MRKRIILIAVVVGMIGLTACSSKKDELSSKKDNTIVKTVEANDEIFEGEDCFLIDYYNDSIDYKNNVIFNPDQNKFIKMADNSYEELEQKYMETNIKYEDFDITLKWYYCKDGERILYKQDLSDVESGEVNNGDYAIYIGTNILLGDTYLLLCKNSTHDGYSFEYPVKFNVETGEIEDVFANATIDGKSVKDYEYLKNWEIKGNEILVDADETFNEPEEQKWERKIVDK